MTRALLTEREREILSGKATDVKNPQKYRSNTRGRIEDRLEKVKRDLDVLEKHEPELADELREAVCEGSSQEALRDVLDDIQADIEELRDEVKDE